VLTTSSSVIELIDGGAVRVKPPPEVWDRLADEVIDQLLAGARTEDEIVGPGGRLPS
jgi:hypothetical protein